MNLRNAIPKIQPVPGTVGSHLLVILGLTGSIMAFEGDIDTGCTADGWYVTTRGASSAKANSSAGSSGRLPAKVAAVQFSPERTWPSSMQLVRPLDDYGQSLRRLDPQSGSRSYQDAADAGSIHQIHLRLAHRRRSAIAPAGKVIVSYAG